MKGEPLSIEELLEHPPALPRSSAPPRMNDSDAPTGRFHAIVPSRAIRRRSVRPSRRPSAGPKPRRGPGAYAAFVAWACSILSLGFFGAAQPPTSWGFFSHFGGASRVYWDQGHLGVALTFGGIAWSLAAAALVMDAVDTRSQINRPAVVALAVASFMVASCIYLLD